MRWLGLLTLLIVGAAVLLGAADEKKPDMPIKGFQVHEWGVWRVHDDVDMANADMRATWDELPAFVYGQTRSRDFPHHIAEPTIAKKPVLFFHSPQPLDVAVRVDFPTGVPAVWWPATEQPAFHDADFRGQSTKPQLPVKYLEWRVFLQQPLHGTATPMMPLSKPHWMQTLRDVKCDDVYVAIGRRNVGQEHEKFVYYDGLLPRVDALTVKVEKDHLSLTNKAKYTLCDLWLIDNRVVSKPRLARWPRLEPGASDKVGLIEVKGDKWAEDAGKALTAQLKDTGLNEDEAASLTTIWASEFFGSAGITVLYRLPQEEYERLLPLTLKPRPEKIVRVGLVQQVIDTPEITERVAKLVKQLDAQEFAVREAAQQELAKFGRAAFGPLRQLRPTITAPEPKRRLDELLEKHDAQRSLKN